jgi:dipeptidyl aminopeptidase/acylaminoacyl peptidase
VLRGLSIVSGAVHRVDLRGGEPTELADLDDVTDIGSLPDGRFWFSGWTDAGVQLGLFDASGEVEIRVVTDGLVTGRDGQPSLVVDGRRSRALGVWENGSHPPEISAIDLDDPKWHQLTRINDAASGIAPLIERRWVRWESTEGVEVRGLLILPKDHDGPMPLVTIIHGGPTWLVPDAFSPAEAGGLALPLVLAGTAVLMPNPRGSSGRGQAYADAVIGRLGEVDLHDVLSGVDQLVDRGVADPQRLAVMGLSYGGFLSAWALTQTNRFRAGVVMSGVADWLSFSQTSNIGRGFTALYHANADEASSEGRQRLLDQSPAHQAVHATAPLLIIHGEQDRVTPVGQAEQFFGAWTGAGTEAEIIVYPREGHELAEPEHLRDARRRVFAWLERHEVTMRSEME